MARTGAKDRDEAARTARLALEVEATGRGGQCLLGLDEELAQALMAGFFGLDPDIQGAVHRLPLKEEAMVWYCFQEWICSLTGLFWKGRTVSAFELACEGLGSALSAPGRGYLEALSGTRLALYEIKELEADRVLLLEQGRPGAEAFWAARDMNAIGLKPGDLAGLRLVRRQGRLEIAKGGMVLGRELGEKVLEDMGRRFARNERRKRKKDRAEIAEACVIDAWLALKTSSVLETSSVQPATSPGAAGGQASSASSSAQETAGGTPRVQLISVDAKNLRLVTDEFSVADWDALDGALERAKDFERGADAKGNPGWNWVEPSKYGGMTILASFMRRGDHLEAFSMSRDRADKARRLLEQEAGNNVAFLNREDLAPSEADRSRHGAGRAVRPLELSPEQSYSIASGFLTRYFKVWVDDGIPALDGKSPREAAKLPAYRQRVADLLRDAEANEARMARRDKRKTVDLGFLWDLVGIKREA